MNISRKKREIVKVPKKESSIRRIRSELPAGKQQGSVLIEDSSVIKELSQQQFSSFNTAKEAFISAILAHEKDATDEDREFLEILIDTDPEFQEQLRSLLMKK